MKLKTLIHRDVRKWFYRHTRYHWLVERWCEWRARSGSLDLFEIGVVLPIKPGDVILDCGANVGDISSRFAASGARVFAFEPSPIVFPVLAKRFRNHPRVQCLNQGVWDSECSLSFSIPARRGSADDIDVSEGSSFLQSNHAIGQTVEVGCVNLVAWLQAFPGRVRLIKMDIEGAECQVIESMLAANVFDKVDFMVVETHEIQMPALAPRIAAIRAELEKRGLAERVRLDWV